MYGSDEIDFGLSQLKISVAILEQLTSKRKQKVRYLL